VSPEPLHGQARFRPHLKFQRWRSRATALRGLGIPILPGALNAVVKAWYGADVPLSISIPDDVVLMHNGRGTVINADVCFDGPAIVFHHVTLGDSWGGQPGAPFVGSHVMIGAGAVVLGGLHLGPNSVVGANAVVTKDVPPGHLAVGNPAHCRPIELDDVHRLFES
jgi:serine O-acetyltransferase